MARKPKASTCGKCQRAPPEYKGRALLAYCYGLPYVRTAVKRASTVLEWSDKYREEAHAKFGKKLTREQWGELLAKLRLKLKLDKGAAARMRTCGPADADSLCRHLQMRAGLTRSKA